jgi:hypothetical protein
MRKQISKSKKPIDSQKAKDRIEDNSLNQLLKLSLKSKINLFVKNEEVTNNNMQYLYW